MVVMEYTAIDELGRWVAGNGFEMDEVNILELKQIIEHILSGLTGDYEKDLNYLKNQSDVYKTHKHSREILQVIGQKMVEILPAELKAKLSRSISDEERHVKEQIEEAIRFISQREWTSAKETIESVIHLIEGQNQNDKESEYYSFHSALESYLFCELYKPVKKVRQTTHDNSLIYRIYGIILMALDQVEEAVQALEVSRRWNPVDEETLFELCDAYKRKDDLDKFIEIAKQSWACATNAGNLARSYRNLGYYYVEEQDYDAAIGLYYLSNSFEPNELATTELNYISKKLNKELEKPDLNQLIALLGDKGITIGANDAVVGLALALAKRAEEKEDSETAKYYYSLVYGLTGDATVKARMEKMMR